MIEILSALEDKIRIPAQPCNILYLLPNDICGSLQSFSAMALTTKTLWRKVSHSSMRIYDGATLIVWCTVRSSCRMHFKPKVNGILDTLQTDVLHVQVPSLLKKSCHLKQVRSHLIKCQNKPTISSDVWKLSAQHSHTENIKVKKRKQLRRPLFKYSVPT